MCVCVCSRVCGFHFTPWLLQLLHSVPRPSTQCPPNCLFPPLSESTENAASWSCSEISFCPKLVDSDIPVQEPSLPVAGNASS